MITQSGSRQVHDRFASYLTQKQLTAVVGLSEASQQQVEPLSMQGATLGPFLVPRVSGTAGNKKVQQHIINTFTQLGWKVEQDAFTDRTPFGQVQFNNIIVTLDPGAQKKLVLAAHFDSKYFKEFEFIGATDSSVPCAILVDIAKKLTPLLHRRSQELINPLKTLQLIFFDGEEAFVNWSENDSIYGARHLAKKWADTQMAVDQAVLSSGGNNARIGQSSPNNQYTTMLQQIEALILLDLLGTSGSTIPNTHPETAWIWDRIVDIQQRLTAHSLVSDELQHRVNVRKDGGIFQAGQSSISATAIEDDHKPFYALGVPIVHCIPVPFPQVWHTEYDDGMAISVDVVKDLALIFRVLVVEYFGLDLYI